MKERVGGEGEEGKAWGILERSTRYSGSLRVSGKKHWIFWPARSAGGGNRGGRNVWSHMGRRRRPKKSSMLEAIQF